MVDDLRRGGGRHRQNALAGIGSLPVYVSMLLGQLRATYGRGVGLAGPHGQCATMVHASAGLCVPLYVRLLFLPPNSLELQPGQHLWPLTTASLIYCHFATIRDLEEMPAA